MAELSIRCLKKTYRKNVQAVKEFSLEVKNGEFIIIVGPSGCGKSTTLRMIAGLETPDSGEILLDNEIINDVPVQKRNMAMVFQNYALYENMTAYENMAFPLHMRKMSKDDIKCRVLETAELLDISDIIDRRPQALSGGEKQRVAMGRAMVRNPKVFLMDEPLSNLDAKLRLQLREEIAKLHKRLAATTVYVTHDQVEAMTLADRIVVMKDGEIVQVGTPSDIYETPKNSFVGGFFGNQPMNLYERNNKIFGIRPEHIVVSDREVSGWIQATCTRQELLGAERISYLEIDGYPMTAVVPACQSMAGQVWVKVNREKVYQFED